jgi:hypothetical protein
MQTQEVPEIPSEFVASHLPGRASNSAPRRADLASGFPAVSCRLGLSGRVPRLGRRPTVRTARTFSPASRLSSLACHATEPGLLALALPLIFSKGQPEATLACCCYRCRGEGNLGRRVSQARLARERGDDRTHTHQANRPVNSRHSCEKTRPRVFSSFQVH